MFSAVSGLQADSTWLDVIGNNISNQNTVGYKASRLEFASQLSQTLNAGSGPDPGQNLGGVNPMQVGLGTRVESIQTLFTEGPLQQTGISTDIAIVGNGFIVAKQGSQTVYTRAGNLTFDGNGNLVTANGAIVQGYTASEQFTQQTINAGAAPLVVTYSSETLTTNGVPQNIQINQSLTIPAKATSQVNFTGNLDSFQQADQPGGVLNLAVGGVDQLPVAAATFAATANLEANPNNAADTVLHQDGNYALNGAAAGAQQANPLVTGGGVSIAAANADANYVWNQNPPVPPAKTVVTTIYNSVGDPIQVTTLFYQVNDLGQAGINTPTSAQPSQVAYAWYSFNTTGGVQPYTGATTATQTPNLLGGSGIIEGYSRNTGNQYEGDLIYFNTDGSLASMGGVDVTTGTQVAPTLYIPPANPGIPAASPLPTNGAQIVAAQLNFGTAGTLGFGQRNGLFSDAEGSYQVVNGVNTYVPSSTAYVSSQNGYADGTLQSVSFDQTGTIQGAFSNGQTVALGQIVMANFANPDGLNNIGGTDFTPSSNSGPEYVGLAGTNGLGTVQGSTLEMSNVDLTTELSNMIIAQNAFDANARVVTVVSQEDQTLTQLGL